MVSMIQNAVDEFLRASQLKTITDIVYDPFDESLIVQRDIRKGRRSFRINVSEAASPAEVVDMIRHRLAVY